ncbi:hypothetical protein SBV1_3300004 [Verrucomicrobia bacterium]|nr:hypothetical protein SBV1_3300004 [Verrucomicrobiota bacterium]
MSVKSVFRGEGRDGGSTGSWQDKIIYMNPALDIPKPLTPEGTIGQEQDQPGGLSARTAAPPFPGSNMSKLQASLPRRKTLCWLGSVDCKSTATFKAPLCGAALLLGGEEDGSGIRVRSGGTAFCALDL